MLEGLMIGAETALRGVNLLLIAVGCLAGMLIGMLPGLGPISAIALLIPVSYALSPESGIMMLAGVYYGAIFGGSTSSILLNAPGVAGTVATAFDGYQWLAKGSQAKPWPSRLCFVYWWNRGRDSTHDPGATTRSVRAGISVPRVFHADGFRAVACFRIRRRR